MIIVWRHRRLVAAVAAACVVIGAVAGLTRVHRYMAKCVLVPSKGSDGSIMGGLAAIDPGLAQLAAAATGRKVTPMMYVEALDMRPVRLAIVRRFRLQQAYDTETVEAAVRELKERTSAKLTTGGFIAVTVEDPDPELAAKVANAYAGELNEFLGALTITQASVEREFLERRMESVRRELVAAEETVRDFQKKNKAIGLKESTSAGIQVYSELKARELALKTRLEVMLSYRTESAPEVDLLKREIKVLGEQMVALEEPRPRVIYANPGTGDRVPEGPIVHIEEIPDIALSYARVLRCLKTKETLFAYLTTQLEAARQREAGDKTAVHVAEPAVPPELPSTMGVKELTILSAFVGGVLSLMAAFVSERLHFLRKIVRTRCGDPGGRGGPG